MERSVRSVALQGSRLHQARGSAVHPSISHQVRTQLLPRHAAGTGMSIKILSRTKRDRAGRRTPFVGARSAALISVNITPGTTTPGGQTTAWRAVGQVVRLDPHALALTVENNLGFPPIALKANPDPGSRSWSRGSGPQTMVAKCAPRAVVRVKPTPSVDSTMETWSAIQSPRRSLSTCRKHRRSTPGISAMGRLAATVIRPCSLRTKDLAARTRTHTPHPLCSTSTSSRH